METAKESSGLEFVVPKTRQKLLKLQKAACRSVIKTPKGESGSFDRKRTGRYGTTIVDLIPEIGGLIGTEKHSKPSDRDYVGDQNVSPISVFSGGCGGILWVFYGSRERVQRTTNAKYSSFELNRLNQKE